MIECGIRRCSDPAEYLEGVLVPKTTRNPPRRIALAYLRDRLLPMVESDWHVESQEAIKLEASEPEPDIAIVRGRVEDDPDRHLGPADVAIVAKVSDSTLAHDRGLEKRICTNRARLLLDYESG